MKVHSNGGYGEYCQFVYMDEDGGLLTACTIDFVPDSRGFEHHVPLYLIFFANGDMSTSYDDPDTLYECLGEL